MLHIARFKNHQNFQIKYKTNLFNKSKASNTNFLKIKKFLDFSITVKWKYQ